MKILYLVNARIPTEKAHGFQIMKTCEALAVQGAKVKLVVPMRKNSLTQDPFLFYNIQPIFAVKKIFIPDTVGWGPLGFYLHTFLFAALATFYAMGVSCDVVYSRDAAPLFFVRWFKRTVLEVHAVPTRFIWLYRLALKKIPRIISTNEWKKNWLHEKGGVPLERIIVLPNAIDYACFELAESRTELCQQLGLAENLRYVVYTGHLYEWKGAQVLAAAAGHLPADVRVLFVGGTEPEIKKLQAAYPATNILFVGQQPHADIPKYLKIAAAAVLPNVPITEESRLATSPLKLFEYMAAGRPIVASDLPSVREIVNEATACLFAPGNSEALAAAINSVLTDSEQAERKARRAQDLVRINTWEARAAKILKSIL